MWTGWIILNLRKKFWYSSHEILYGGFLKWGYLQIIHVSRIFPLQTIHVGVPPFMETPMWIDDIPRELPALRPVQSLIARCPQHPATNRRNRPWPEPKSAKVEVSLKKCTSINMVPHIYGEISMVKHGNLELQMVSWTRGHHAFVDGFDFPYINHPAMGVPPLWKPPNLMGSGRAEGLDPDRPQALSRRRIRPGPARKPSMNGFRYRKDILYGYTILMSINQPGFTSILGYLFG